MQLIAVPTAVSSNFKNISKHVIATRAMENGVYVAYVNHAKGEFYGYSVRCNPNGDTVVAAGEEESLLFAAIDADFRPQCSYLGDRKPGLYKDLVKWMVLYDKTLSLHTKA